LGFFESVFTVVAKLDPTVAGLVGGIFRYLLLDPTSTADQNETDTKLIFNDLGILRVNSCAGQRLRADSP
jgi:hypothetical protein